MSATCIILCSVPCEPGNALKCPSRSNVEEASKGMTVPTPLPDVLRLVSLRVPRPPGICNATVNRPSFTVRTSFPTMTTKVRSDTEAAN